MKNKPLLLLAICVASCAFAQNRPDGAIDQESLRLYTPELLKKPLPISRPLVNGNPFNRNQKVETRKASAPANAADIALIEAQLAERLIPAISSVFRSEPSAVLVKGDSVMLRFRENMEVHFGTYENPEPVIENGRVMLREVNDRSVSFLVYGIPKKGDEFTVETTLELPAWFHRR